MRNFSESRATFEYGEQLTKITVSQRFIDHLNAN